MNPLDALNPKIGDEELIRSYGNSITDLVTDNYTLSNVILDERIWSHKQYSDLMLLILGGCEESLADWDLAPKIVRELQEEVKRLTEFRDKVLAAFIEMPQNSRSLTYLLNAEGYLKHYTLEDYRKGLHPYSLGLYELHEEWKEKVKQYLEDDE